MERTIKVMSWNVNGIRAAHKKGFSDWLREASPDLLGLQETRSTPEQMVEKLRNPEGYHSYWVSAEKKRI